MITLDAYRQLPSVDSILRDPALAEGGWPRQLTRDTARAVLTAVRERIRAGAEPPLPKALIDEIVARLQQTQRPNLRPVINATGVILHTNLGRAPISEEAAAAMTAIAAGYSNLEFDLESGERGSRTGHLRDLLHEITGAEDGLVVNNNAGAVLLALSALAAGREVIISRGQAVEIGGGFRIPDVMRQSGARLVEVGTTNRTYRRDYESAITPNTALLLRIHPSNFRIEGFVHSVEIRELAELGRLAGIAVMDDIGSGAILDPTRYGLGAEPLVPTSVRDGATIVCFSGDKLLGGPQAGLIVGQREPIELIRRHPLARALRIDKASLAGLEVTLRHYQRGEATQAIPIWRMIAEPTTSLEGRAQRLARQLAHPEVAALETRAAIGGGSLPQETLPSWGIRIATAPTRPVTRLGQQLREQSPPIVSRIERDALWLDLRTVPASVDSYLLTILRQLL